MSPHRPLLAPSLLAADHGHLDAGARKIAELGLVWAHLDIMDGHFVPNLTFGPQTLADLRHHEGLFFDVHLMLDNPDAFVEPFIKAGANNVTIHVEPDYPVRDTLERIRALGSQAGITLNPGTPVSAVEPYLDAVDLVLVMTVQPGYGGQSFRDDQLPKIAQLDAWRAERKLGFRLEVDGGVDLETGPRCREAGADTFVAGTAFFKAEDPGAFAERFAALP